MKFEALSLREKVCQLMAPTVHEYLEHGGNSEQFPIGFLFVEPPAYEIDEKTGISQFDKITGEFCGKVPLGVAADGINGFGGITAPLRKMRIGAANDENLAFKCGKAYGMQLIYNRVDWSFEPSCDLVRHPMSVMSSDAFSDIPEISAAMASAFVRGLQSVGVAATVKHFPGLGSCPTNPHWTKARNLLSMEEWENTEGYVYKKAIEAGVAAIMTSHIAFPAACTEKDEHGKYPIATVSHEITTGLLKEKLGFQGVVVTDALTMGGAGCNDTLNTTVKAFEAGSDVLLFANLDAVDVITAKLESGEIPMSRLEDALNRIYELKKKTGVLDRKRNTECLDEEFVRQVHREEARLGITVRKWDTADFPIDKKKIKKLCVVGITCGGNPNYTPLIMRLETEGFCVDFKENIYLKDEKAAKEFQSKYDLILFTFAGGSPVPIIPGEVGQPCVWTLNRIDPEKKYVIQFGMPKLYDLYFQDEPVYINPFETNPATSAEIIDNLVKVLIGERTATGIMPYKLAIDENY